MKWIIFARLGFLLLMVVVQTRAETRSPTLCSAMETAWRMAPGKTTVSTWPTKLTRLGLSFPAWRPFDDPDRIIALRTDEYVRLAKFNKIYMYKRSELLSRDRVLLQQKKEDLAYSTITIGTVRDIKITRLGVKISDTSKDGSISREDWYYDLRFDIPDNDEPQFIDGMMPLQVGGHWYLYHNGGGLYDLVIWKDADKRIRITTSDSAFCVFKFAGERN